MSKLEELINQLCPDGVEYKTIADICKISRGRVMSKDYIAENIGDYPVYSSQTENEGMLGKISTYDYEGEFLTWTTDGANAGSVFYRNGKFSVTNVCGLLKVTSTDVTTKFLYYTLHVEAPKYVNSGMGNPKLMSNVMAKIAVPLPPLPVQEEIVRILDNMTSLTAELTAELKARQKQYEYYRDSLLSFDEDNTQDGVRWMKLEDVAIFRNGKGHEKEIVENGRYIVVNSKFISTDGKVKKFSEQQLCPVYANDVLMVMSDLPNGKALAKCFYVEKDSVYSLNQRICALTSKNDTLINSRYFFYILNRNRMLLKYDNGVDQTNLKKSDILNLVIPVPTLEEQQRIVDILDRFDKLCNDISEGLPAEIEARKKQYEYYRDKLLTFKEKEA